MGHSTQLHVDIMYIKYLESRISKYQKLIVTFYLILASAQQPQRSHRSEATPGLKLGRRESTRTFCVTAT